MPPRDAYGQDLAVVTVTYSPGETLDTFLDSVLKATSQPVRVLLVDNLIFSGKTIVRFADTIEELGGQVVGAATLWTTADVTAAGKPIFGVFNGDYPVFPVDDCPFCKRGVPLEHVRPVR